MTNDLNTISGVLAEAVDKLEANLNSMGVYATYDPTDGYLALLDEILNIAPSVGGINLSTAISLTNTPSVVKAHDTVLLSATVHADYDDRSQANIDMNGYLQGATVSFYDGNTLLGTGVTGADGVATFTVTDISYGSHSFKAEYDGTGTSYDSAVSSVLNVTAEHDYSLEFGQDSYTASAGSCNVTVTLLDNGVPVAGETVSLTGSDSSLYSGITNQNGIASYNLSTSQGVVTFTASWNNITAICDVLNYILYDDASEDNSITLFSDSIALRNNGSNTINHYNDYYILTNNGSEKESMRVLTPLTGCTGDFIFEYDSYSQSNQGTSGFIIYNGTNAWEKLADNVDNSRIIWYGYNNGSFWEQEFRGSTTTYTRWVHYKYTVQGNNFTMEISEIDTGDVIFSHTVTIHFTRTSTTKYGLNSEWNNGVTTYYKNLKAYSI